MVSFYIRSVTAVACFVLIFPAAASVIQKIDYSEIQATEVVDFRLGSRREGIFQFGSVQFGERFLGQIVTESGVPSRPNEILSGTPTAPLTLVSDSYLDSLYRWSGDSIYLLGSTTNSDGTQRTSVGEGSIAALFDYEVFEFGFRFKGGGPATVQIFDANGNLLYLDSDIVVSEELVAFRSSLPIAGFTLHNEELGGLGMDDLAFRRYVLIEEPPILVLLSVGLVFIVFYVRQSAAPKRQDLASRCCYRKPAESCRTISLSLL